MSAMVEEKPQPRKIMSQESESPCKECSESSDDLDEEEHEYGSEQEFGDDDDELKEPKTKGVINWKFPKLDKAQADRSKSF